MKNTKLPSIGFVGLGHMGGAMCRRLSGAGYAVTAFDIKSAALDAAVEAGACAASSVDECAAAARLFFTSLPHPRHVESVMVGDGAGLAALESGAIWVDLTTNSGELIRHLAEAAPDGVQVVDAPVTGAVDGARTGNLTLFVGGDKQPVDRVVPVLEHLGHVIRCGPLGSGNTVKLVTNQLWFVHAAALAEGFAVGMANGVDLGTLWQAIRESVANSFVAEHDAPSVFAGHYDPSFTLDLCLKDLRLMAELAENVSTSLPMTEAAHGVFANAAERYGRDAGEMHVAKRIEEDAGLSMRLDGDWPLHWEK